MIQGWSRLFFATALLLSAAPRWSYAATRYVATTGSDSHDGSQASPWATIQFAANSVSPGDSVLVADGTYPEFVTIQSSGSSDTTRIVLQSENPQGAKVIGFRVRGDFVTIDGFDVEADMSSHTGITVQGRSHVKIIRCFVHECPAHGIHIDAGPAPDYALGSFVEVTDNTIYRVTQAGVGLTANNSLVQGNQIIEVMQYHPKGELPDFEGEDADGMRIHGDGNVVRNNTIRDLAATPTPANIDPHPDCVQSFGAGSDPVMTNTLFEGNYCQSPHSWSHGILIEPKTGNTCRNIQIINNVFEFRDMGIVMVDGAFDTIEIYHNLFKAALGDQSWGTALHMQDVSNYQILNNIMVDCHPESRKVLGGTGTIDYNFAWHSDGSSPGGTPSAQAHETWGPAVNPMFAFYDGNQGGDYRLQEGSGLIDKAIAIAAVTTDRAGNPRPYGSATDIGPYEYSGIVPVLDAGTDASPSHDANAAQDTSSPIPDSSSAFDSAASVDGSVPGDQATGSDEGCSCSSRRSEPSTRTWVSALALLALGATFRRRPRSGAPRR